MTSMHIFNMTFGLALIVCGAWVMQAFSPLTVWQIFAIAFGGLLILQGFRFVLDEIRDIHNQKARRNGKAH